MSPFIDPLQELTHVAIKRGGSWYGLCDFELEFISAYDIAKLTTAKLISAKIFHH